MKVSWLDYELSEACVECGLLWWKRQAICVLVTIPPTPSSTPQEVWRFQNSGTDCNWSVRHALELARAAELQRRQRQEERQRWELDWQPVRRSRRLPKAIAR